MCFQSVSISDKEQLTSASLKFETIVPKGSEVSVRCVLKLSFSLIGSGAGKTHAHHLFTTSEFQNVNYFLIKCNSFSCSIMTIFSLNFSVSLVILELFFSQNNTTSFSKSPHVFFFLALHSYFKVHILGFISSDS